MSSLRPGWQSSNIGRLHEDDIPHFGVKFSGEISSFSETVLIYSYRKASIGLSMAALRAGKNPKKMPMAAEKKTAMRMIFV